LGLLAAIALPALSILDLINTGWVTVLRAVVPGFSAAHTPRTVDACADPAAGGSLRGAGRQSFGPAWVVKRLCAGSERIEIDCRGGAVHHGAARLFDFGSESLG